MDVRGKKVKLSIWVGSSCPSPSHQSIILINSGRRIPLAKNDSALSLPPTTAAPKV